MSRKLWARIKRALIAEVLVKWLMGSAAVTGAIATTVAYEIWICPELPPHHVVPPRDTVFVFDTTF